MSESERADCETIGPTDAPPTDRLPPAIGVDADGLVHHVAAQFPSVAILTDGDEIVTTCTLPTMAGREDWVTEVQQTRGWADCWAAERLTPAEIEQRIAAAQR